MLRAMEAERYLTKQRENYYLISHTGFDVLNTRGLPTSFWRSHLGNVG